MEIKIYVDVLFFTNLFMDYALLYICAKITKAKISLIKILLASLFGALYGVFSFFIKLPVSLLWFVKISIGAVMVFISLTPKSIINFIKYTFIFFAVTFCCGGILFSLLYFTKLGSSLQTVVSGGIIYMNIPIYKLIFACGVCYIIMTIFSISSKKYKKLFGIIYDVTVTLEGKSVTLKAILDSGNSLKEPLSNHDVIVAEKNALNPLFTSEDYADNLIKDKKYNSLYIYCKSITGREKIIAFMPDSITINGKQTYAYIGISKMKISENFNALLPYNFNERIE